MRWPLTKTVVARSERRGESSRTKQPRSPGRRLTLPYQGISHLILFIVFVFALIARSARSEIACPTMNYSVLQGHGPSSNCRICPLYVKRLQNFQSSGQERVPCSPPFSARHEVQTAALAARSNEYKWDITPSNALTRCCQK